MTLASLLQRRSGGMRLSSAARPSTSLPGSDRPARATAPETIHAVEGGQRVIHVAVPRHVPPTGKVAAAGLRAPTTSEYPVVRGLESVAAPPYPALQYSPNPRPASLYPSCAWPRSAPPDPHAATSSMQQRSVARRRAPAVLRVGVALLAAAAAGAVAIALERPSWLPKNIAPSSVGGTVADGPAASTPMALISTTPSQSVYAVAVRSFALSVTIDHPCWVIVKSVPDGKTVFEQTLEPGGPRSPIAVTGSASILIAARANAIVVTAGSRTIGTVVTPVVGHTYLFAGNTGGRGYAAR